MAVIYIPIFKVNIFDWFTESKSIITAFEATAEHCSFLSLPNTNVEGHIEAILKSIGEDAPTISRLLWADLGTVFDLRLF